jgi:hypothetical protein
MASESEWASRRRVVTVSRTPLALELMELTVNIFYLTNLL